MPSKDIEEFARTLVRHVRDEAIRSCDMNLQPECKGMSAQRWRALGAPDHRALVETVIADSVDEAVFALLDAIDQGRLRLAVVTHSGKPADLGREGRGELGGWYVGTGGWRDRFSDERVGG